MQFELPRRQRKSFEAITKSSLSDKFNKEQSIEVFNKIRKEYENSPNTFGSSSGKKAKAISDRSGMAFPYIEMLKEWNGSFVHQSEFESKHPQIELKTHKPDRQALQNARSDRDETSVPNLLKLNAFETSNQGTSVITVTESDHGRSSSDTVRFYGASSFDGITATNLTRSAGYTITKVDDNS